MYQSLDDVPERDIARSLDFLAAVLRSSPSRTAASIAADISNECLLRGSSAIPHKEMARRAGVGRRTLDNNIKRLLREGFIRRVGTTPSGSKIYRACFDRVPGERTVTR